MKARIVYADKDIILAECPNCNKLVSTYAKQIYKTCPYCRGELENGTIDLPDTGSTGINPLTPDYGLCLTNSAYAAFTERLKVISPVKMRIAKHIDVPSPTVYLWFMGVSSPRKPIAERTRKKLGLTPEEMYGCDLEHAFMAVSARRRI